MKHTTRNLMVAILGLSSCLSAALQSDRTFLAHRADINNLALQWSSQHHIETHCNAAGSQSRFTATPFYGVSTNHDDMAHLFGIGTTKKITVTGATRPSAQSLYDTLFSFNLDHSPNSDGTTSGQVPMYGTAAFHPERRTSGVHINWQYSLENIVKGLSLRFQAPFMQVSTTMGATFPKNVASTIPATDGTASHIDEYFSGTLSKASSHVLQNPLTRQKFDKQWHNVVGVGDLITSLHWDCHTVGRTRIGLSASLQLPTGAVPTGEWLFEPITGARGHTAAGLGLDVTYKGISKGALTVDFNLLADWKYFFKSAETRTLGLQDLSEGKAIIAGSYRNIVKDKHAGVTPSANMLTVNVDVTPGHQFEGLVGARASWFNWHFDIGYNLYLHEKEKVEHKTWGNDTYAIAHHRYSTSTTALGTKVLGGNTILATGVNQAGATGTGSYDDPLSPVGKHGNRIGANRDGWTFELYSDQRDTGDLGSTELEYDKPYAPANVSSGGPIQEPGKTTSKLSRRHCEEDAGGTTVNSTDYTGQDFDATGGNAGTLEPSFNVTTSPCSTESQVTHSLVGALGYKFTGTYPMIVAIGAQGEFQGVEHNSALEGWKAWMKFGVSF